MNEEKKVGMEWLALVTAISWGAGSFFGKRAMKIGHLSPLVGIILRTVFALILFALLLSLFGRKINANFRKEVTNAWKESKWGLFQIIIFEGLLAGGLGMFLYYLAISNGELSLVMPLAFLSPFWGTLLALLWRDEKVIFQRIAGLIVTLSGIFIITSRIYAIEELLQWRIEYVALLTGLCWGIGSFFGKRGMKKASITPFVGITIRTIISLIFLLIAIFSFGPSLLDSYLFGEIGWIVKNELGQFFLILLFEGGIAGFLGMLVYYISIRKGELSLIMPLAFTSPFWGTLLALIFGTEQLTAQRLAGMVLILFGIAYTSSPNFLKPIEVKRNQLDFSNFITNSQQ